jgi:hypothetical protein
MLGRTFLMPRLLAAALACCLPSAAYATVSFQRVFLEAYLAEHPDPAFVAYVRGEARCNTCHQGSKNRANRNAFGHALAALLDARADRKDTAKILAALHKVETSPADPSNPAGG